MGVIETLVVAKGAAGLAMPWATSCCKAVICTGDTIWVAGSAVMGLVKMCLIPPTVAVAPSGVAAVWVVWADETTTAGDGAAMTGAVVVVTAMAVTAGVVVTPEGAVPVAITSLLRAAMVAG